VRQTHGVSRFAAAMRKLRDSQRTDEANLMAMLMEACIGLSIERASGTPATGGLANPIGEDGTDGDGNREVNWQPGMVHEAAPGEKVTFLNPNRPGGQYAPFMESQIRAVGAATGLGYGQVSLDYTKGVYSGQRQEMVETFGEFDILQQIIIEQLCGPIWRRFISLAVMEGRLNAPDFFANPSRYYACDWMGPERPWIDPLKEIQAIKEEIALGLNTRKRVLNAKGMGLRSTFAQLKAEEELADENGIDVSGTDGGAGTTSVDNQDAADAPADKGKALVVAR